MRDKMRGQLEKRLQELKAEFESGQKKLADLEAQANTIRNTLLRISGAIQVLEEELGKYNDAHGEPPQPTERELEATTEAEVIPDSE
jgi:predicted nuclease with TOPRIM domain